MTDELKRTRRTHTCGDLKLSHQGQAVVLKGWVHRRRDHGGLIFIDLRDRYGVTQIVFNPAAAPEAHGIAQKLRSEWVIAVSGSVQGRPPGTTNPNLSTGEIEIAAAELVVLNEAKTPPFVVEDAVGADVSEETRLKYRYVDLRRPKMQRTFLLRHKAALAARQFLDREGFLEIETPMMLKSTPEGARDFVVPSRLHPGQFYVLPQSPQTLKQILMISGFDKYFQIARCMRDEDLRGDRQYEFTQIDMEMSFPDVDSILSVSERLIQHLFRETIGVELPLPFRRISHAEAMARYGNDKPDARFGMELTDLTVIASRCGLRVFRESVEKGGQVKAILAKNVKFTPGQLDQLKEITMRFGAKGLAWIQYKPEGPDSPIVKHLGEPALGEITAALGATAGDTAFFIADQPKIVAETLSRLRLHLGEQLQLIPQGVFHCLWILDFPMFAWNAEEKKWDAEHHPFTSPRPEDIPYLESDPGRVLAQAYDLVINGYEAASGSIRIHERSVQEHVFKIIGLTPEEAKERFGFLMEAFEYGAPPHGGIAPGLDRLMMLMLDEKNIREVIAFPKTQRGTCLLTGAPSTIPECLLKELHLKVAE